MDRFYPHESGIWIGKTYKIKDWKWTEWKDSRTPEQRLKDIHQALEAHKN